MSTIFGMLRELWVCHLGRVAYAEAAELQESLRGRVIAGELPGVMLLLEHPPVYTLGRRSQPGDLPLSEDWLRERGIDVVRTPRGGKLTYHGPGQLVGYPIVHVGDVAEYVGAMERALVTALGEAGVSARGRSAEGPAFTGIWVQDRKIASIGVHLSHGVSTHGFAINVDNDMTPWSWVTACGMPDVRMTSVVQEGVTERIPCLRKRVAYAMTRELGLRQRLVSPARLAASVPSVA
jgi:lipoyl(octanoyl) transferase